MTNEEHIEQLKKLRSFHNGSYGRSINKAIDALKQEPYEDAISRQAVIEQTYNWSKDEFLRVANPFDYLRKRINSLPSVKPQEPFNIDTYCKEHFMVMVDKDVWEKAEKALEQEPKYCDRNICLKNEYNGIGCGECEVTKSQEPKTGHWIGIDEEPHEDYECDKCGYIVSTFTANIEPHTEYKYCPNCGARMES